MKKNFGQPYLETSNTGTLKTCVGVPVRAFRAIVTRELFWVAFLGCFSACASLFRYCNVTMYGARVQT